MYTNTPPRLLALMTKTRAGRILLARHACIRGESYSSHIRENSRRASLCQPCVSHPHGQYSATYARAYYRTYCSLPSANSWRPSMLHNSRNRAKLTTLVNISASFSSVETSAIVRRC